MSKNKIRVGHWCRVYWSDVGMVDGIIVDFFREDSYVTVYQLDGTLCRPQLDQIVEVGHYIGPVKTGLSGYPV